MLRPTGDQPKGNGILYDYKKTAEKRDVKVIKAMQNLALTYEII